MDHQQEEVRLRVFCFIFTHAILLCFMGSHLSSANSNLGNHSDLLALLAFKDGITQDPLHIMKSWNHTLHFCKWTGVTCNPANQRVTLLNLDSQRLVGSLSPSIGNLTFLSAINLQNNSFHGEIPQEIGRLTRLQDISMAFNFIGGNIPSNLSHCMNLRTLNLSHNNISGYIPDQLSSLSKIHSFGLAVNSLTGSIPPWIGNFSSLFTFSLLRNSFQGTIPDELGRLCCLGKFQVSGNELSGEIPSSLYNISSIYFISVAVNSLQGSFPIDVGLNLPNLQIFYVDLNNFTGSIPMSLSNATGLEEIDLGGNGMTGPVPVNLGSLKRLIKLNLQNNSLGSGQSSDLDFLIFLNNCTNLQALSLAGNHLGGELRDSIGNLSSLLTELLLGSNLIHGSIPAGIGNLASLTVLGMEENLFSGSIPATLGKLKKLQKFSLAYNRLSGLIPSSLGNLTQLSNLYMMENNLEGNVPASLGNCQNLLELDFSSNKLNGTIPKEVIGIPSFSISFVVGSNSLTGSLPLEVGNLKNLGVLVISENNFSGEIPNTLGSCTSLEHLYMAGNSFQGSLPLSFENLRALQEVDLSRNKLSRVIPEYLVNFSSLERLNLSFNDFEGEVPKQGIFANASAISVIGNNGLCGGIPELQLPRCFKEAVHKGGKASVSSMKIIIFVVILTIVVVISCSVGIFFWMRSPRKRDFVESSNNDWQLRLSYLELFRSTNGFSVDNLVGIGTFGSVYKAVLQESEEVVAVKVFNLQQRGASKSFAAECETLKNIRHRNLVKILTACSSIDFEGNEFNALVYEFMPNGSLDEWLHPRIGQIKGLNLIQRLNIAIDVAAAIEYLHFDCETPIIHCDLKPSNVLLDKDMTGHVGDFGLARFLSERSNNQSTSTGIKGSIGYIPLGKSPIDDMFKDGRSLHEYVAAAWPEQLTEIADPLLFLEEEEIRNNREESPIVHERNRSGINAGEQIRESLLLIIQIGLSCSNPSPRARMTMKDVGNKLHVVRDSILQKSK
ncbi:probable LRR receptor-like serine/threonine-protein kinase At3g47570 isoform X2 [Macadamia integrifolia]|uniref:probable LRR receptor-like serine/threonine-protein kinase At3g47570 isoform X2 n=1 Tax=Macadamia integrifolia TaxID=60698 RepID=UPI001C4E986B|nr:probable LRR receptor-like serine/threonine-protein kinase At3g47570 isoform X2 [Macadamia integrifolia]